MLRAIGNRKMNSLSDLPFYSHVVKGRSGESSWESRLGQTKEESLSRPEMLGHRESSEEGKNNWDVVPGRLTQ